MFMKKALLNLYYFGNNKKDRIDSLQTIIRDLEWKSIVDFIPNNSNFLDIGCGAGYSMKLAEEGKNCKVTGIDPDPNAHGVGRNWEGSSSFKTEHKIHKAYAENLPFEEKSFDVVYSSHVLEHVQDEMKVLEEINRVTKDDGIIIIGVPTASMALINMVSQVLFLSHQRIVNFILSRLGFKSFPKISLKHLLFLYSHSFQEKTIFYDLKKYKVKNWSKIISKELTIQKVILPALYPYPDYIQLFKLKKRDNYSSSVFFICKK